MNDVEKLVAIDAILDNPDIIKMMAEFKRRTFDATYIIENQIEDESELIYCWLKDVKQTIYRNSKTQ